MLKIQSTPIDGKLQAQIRKWSTDTSDTKFHIPAIPYVNRNVMTENSQGYSSPSSLAPPLPTLDLLDSEFFLQIIGRKVTSMQNHCSQMVLHWDTHLMFHLLINKGEPWKASQEVQ